jgi:hypothetical protein
MIRPGIMTIGIALTIMLVLTVIETNNLFAAKKLFEIKLSNVNVNYNFEGTACGVSGDLTVKTHVTHFRSIIWDNGHSTYQITFSSKTYDSNGKLIANVPVGQHGGVAPYKESPFNFHFQESVTAVCTGNSETPGKSQNWFYTYFIQFDAESGVTTVDAIAQPF